VAVGLGEGALQFVADAQVERQIGPRAPVVLREQVEAEPAQPDVSRAVADGRLLWHAEQEVREVEAAVEPGEHEGAARVGHRASVRDVTAHAAPEPQRVALQRARERVVGAEPRIGSSCRSQAPQAGQPGEGERRHAPVERILGNPGDAGGAGGIQHSGELRSRQRVRVRGGHAHVVDRAAAQHVELNRRRERRRFVGAAEQREDVDGVCIAALVLHLRVQHHRVAAAESAPSAPAASAAESAAAALPPLRRGREVVRDPQADPVGRRTRRGGAAEVLRGPRQIGQRNVGEQRARGRIDPAGRNAGVLERLPGARIDG
jgi:hypothetical protein